MTGGSDGYPAFPRRRQRMPGPISLFPGTAGLLLFIFFFDKLP